jgi:hypothetical protein
LPDFCFFVADFLLLIFGFSFFASHFWIFVFGFSFLVFGF